MFQQRTQNLATAQKPAVRDARRDNGKPRKRMPTTGVPAMAPQQGQEAAVSRVDRIDQLVDRMRQTGPPERTTARPSGGASSSVGSGRGMSGAVEKLMRARAAAMARRRLM